VTIVKQSPVYTFVQSISVAHIQYIPLNNNANTLLYSNEVFMVYGMYNILNTCNVNNWFVNCLIYRYCANVHHVLSNNEFHLLYKTFHKQICSWSSKSGVADYNYYQLAPNHSVMCSGMIVLVTTIVFYFLCVYTDETVYEYISFGYYQAYGYLLFIILS
jgi:hypothetical protein